MKIPISHIRKIAMDLLAIREHSRYELFSKLEARGFEKNTIQQVIEQLQKENLQNDQRFSESYLKSKSNRGYGPVRIRQELLDRGIDDETIGNVLDHHDPEWIDVAERERIKKFENEIPESYAEKAKQMRFLQYRGFTFDQIKGVMGKVTDSD